MSARLWSILFIVFAVSGGLLFIGCEGDSGDDNGGSDSTPNGTDTNAAQVGAQQLDSGRATINGGGSFSSSIVTAPAAGVIVTELSVPEDHVSVTAWLQDADVPGPQYDKQTGPVLTLTTVTASGKHWRMVIENANPTLLHVNYTTSYRP
jgi:hypothetical protein